MRGGRITAEVPSGLTSDMERERRGEFV